jgi:uncharacterized small protein (DUF1192 family)
MASLNLLRAEYIVLENRVAEKHDEIEKLNARMLKKAEAIVDAGGEVPSETETSG